MGERVGPRIERPCGYCTDDPLPLPDCPSCGGSGRVAVEVHPFVALEALHEHLDAVRIAVGIVRPDAIPPAFGSPGYHLNAADELSSALLQQLIVLLPEEYARTEGEEP